MTDSPKPKPTADPAVELARRYSIQAQAYRDYWAPVLLPMGVRCLREIPFAPERVLEVGSGVGALLPVLHSTYPAALVIGVDRSPGMLALAPKVVPLALMDATHLAAASQTFDLVLMNFVLFHLVDPLAGLLEANRVLKPGGLVVTVTWGTDLQSVATRIWDEELDFHGSPQLDLQDGLTRHDLVDSPEKLERLLHAAGFDSIRAWEEPCKHVIDLEHLLHLRTRLGRSLPRYEYLDAEKRGSCVSRVRERLFNAPPDWFLATGRIVYAFGTKPR